MLQTKNINKYFFIWIIICIVYLSLIGYLTYLYPLSGDEILYDHYPTIWQYLKYFVTSPYMALRIGCLFSISFLYIGHIFYVILNPFFQLGIIFSAFYFIYLRLPNFKNLKDLPSFILMLVLGTLFIAQPSDVIFWVGGATNYAWVFIAFIWFLIYLRKLARGIVFKNKYFSFFCIFWGMFLGLINENNSPMVLCLMLAFSVFAYFRKIVLRHDFWFLFIGTCIGVYILFAFSGNDVRLNIISFGVVIHYSIFEKLLMHLSHIHLFAKANLCLIYLLPIFLFLIALDKKKLVFKNESFYLSALCWMVAFGLAIVLCAAPRVATRAFYSATWFCNFSLIFFLLEIETLYKIKIIKYLSGLSLLIFLYVMPFFVFGVSAINNMVQFRQNIIDRAKIKGQKEIYLFFCRYDNSNLPENWQIIYWDALVNPKMWSKIEGIEIRSDLEKNVRYF